MFRARQFPPLAMIMSMARARAAVLRILPSKVARAPAALLSRLRAMPYFRLPVLFLPARCFAWGWRSACVAVNAAAVPQVWQ